MEQGYTIGIAGKGGDGVILLGELLARTAAQAGLHCFLSKSFGPQIRGGETSVRLTIAPRPLHCPGDRCDLLAVLSWEGLAHFAQELMAAPEADVLCDLRADVDPKLLAQLGTVGKVHLLPLEQLALEVAATKLARNMVLAGALWTALGWPVAALAAQLAERFIQRTEAEQTRNAAALVAGAAAGPALRLYRQPPVLPHSEPLELLSGNDLLCRGALAAGCRYFAGYPISPATEILETMLRELPKLGGSCVQAEDEIAAAGLALGAAYGGVPALTATSGPGFSLMAETIGLAVATELPLVVVDCQRVGPSTGIPTRTEQSDLNMALYGRHGDAPCVVLAPVDIGDCATLTQSAFGIAAQHRTPVILLSDQYLAQGVATSTTTPGNARCQPASRIVNSGDHGQDAPAPHSLTGLVHLDSGEPSSDPLVHAELCTRRAAKLEALRTDGPPSAFYRPLTMASSSQDELGILTWGSSFGPCCALADTLVGRGIAASVCAPRLLYPLPRPQLAEWLAGVAGLFVPELNHSGQFWHYLRSQIDLPPISRIPYHRPGGSAFSVQELQTAIEPLLPQ